MGAVEPLFIVLGVSKDFGMKPLKIANPLLSNGHILMHPPPKWTPKFLVHPLPNFFALHTPIISSAVVCWFLYWSLYFFHEQMSETSAGKYKHRRMGN